MSISNNSLDVIEASYRLGTRDEEWLWGVASAARRAQGRDQGVAAFLFDASSPAHGVRVREHVLIDAPEAALEAIRAFHDSLSPADIEALFWQPAVCATLSQMGLEPDARTRALGFDDVLAVQATDASKIGCCFLFSPHNDNRTLSASMRKEWHGVAHHLRAALRLRRRLGPTSLWDRTRVEVVPEGRVIDAHGPVRVPDAPAVLQEFCRAIDGPHGRRGTEEAGDRGDAAQVWSALISGQWTLVEHFEKDGHRYFIAVRNGPEAEAVVKLTERERQVVSRVMKGYSVKLVAFEIRADEDMVRVDLNRAMTKLRVRSRTDLVALGGDMECAQVEMDGEAFLVMRYRGGFARVLDAWGLTSAEKEVAIGILEGKTNRAIAQARGTRMRTVANQVQSLFRKLGVNSRAQLVAELAQMRAPSETRPVL